MKWKVTILINNYTSGGKLRAEHGYSLALEGRAEQGEERSILFDTGQSWDILSWNAELLGLDIAAVDTIVLSHGHYDHTGALREVLERVSDRTVLYAHPETFFTKYNENRDNKIISSPVSREELGASKVRLVEETGAQEIAPRLWTTGQIARGHAIEEEAHRWMGVERDGRHVHDELPDDQSLIIRGEKGGFYLICGCCHSGLINTLEHAVRMTGERKVLGIIGGLHTIGASEERLQHTVAGLRSFDPGFIAPLHCAGVKETAVLYRELGEKVRFLSVGDSLEM